MRWNLPHGPRREFIVRGTQRRCRIWPMWPNPWPAITGERLASLPTVRAGAVLPMQLDIASATPH